MFQQANKLMEATTGAAAHVVAAEGLAVASAVMAHVLLIHVVSIRPR
jgi:hypothetical protein